MTDWMDDAKCAGVRDFTEWPAKSRAILCDACPVREKCNDWMGDLCINGHDTRATGRDEGGWCSECRRSTVRQSLAAIRQRNRDNKAALPRAEAVAPLRAVALPGMCRNDHLLAEVGVDSRGICRECRREANRRYDARMKEAS